MSIKVAVTMSTYNGVEWLKNISIPSLLAQTHKDWVLFITHDGFEVDKLDEVYELVMQFNDPRIRLSGVERFLPPTDEQNWPIGSREWGIAGYNALNHSLDSITYFNKLLDDAGFNPIKYIFHMDQDDAYHPNHMENMIQLLENNPDTDLVYAQTDFYLFDKHNGTLGNSFDKLRFMNGNYIAHSSIAYRVDANHPWLYSLEGNEPSDYNFLKGFITASGKDFKQSVEITCFYYQRCSIEFAKNDLRLRGILP